MNQSVKTDDELIALLEETMRNVARLAPGMSLDEPRDNRWMVTAAAAVIVVAGAAGAALVASNRQDRSPLDPAADAPASTSPDTSPSAGTLAPDQPVPSPWPPHATIPDVFPPDVPRPDTFDTMTYITWDNEPVGWQFLERGERTDSVERCTQYAAVFDESWTSTAITDEAASVLYSRYYSNAAWRVGIYCTETGDYLVQVMPTAATSPPTVDTAVPASTINEETDWTDPSPATSFDEPAELGGLVRQADVLHRDECMATRGLEYRLPPFAFDPPITEGPESDVWQQWYDDKVDSTPGWEAELLECADEFLNSGWAGDISSAGYVSEVRALQVTGRDAVWRTPEITPLVDDIVACAHAHGGSVSTPVAEDPERAYEQARDILEPLISIENIDGMSQHEYIEAREAAFDAVCPALLDLDRAVNTARQEIERQWLLTNPGTAQRINDEWADDIVRLRQIIASYDLDALTG